MTLRMELGENGYDIVIERGCLKKAGDLLSLDRKVLIVTDDGVPEEYAKTVAESCKTPTVVTITQGEASKSFPVLEKLLSRMLAEGFSRADCVCAVGGGWSAIFPRSPPRSICAGSIFTTSRRPCSRKPTVRSAARPGSTSTG